MKTMVCSYCRERTCVVCLNDKKTIWKPLMCPFTGDKTYFHELKNKGDKNENGKPDAQ